MKTKLLISLTVFFSLISVYSCRRSEFGYAIINPFQPIYEDDDSYSPHDLLVTSDWLGRPIEIHRTKKHITITNTSNYGLSGYKVVLELTPKLKIINAQFNRWYDVIIEGTCTEYIVEKVILELDKNPFKDTLITGHYSLQIQEIFHSGERTYDTATYSIFNGKFKVYNNYEIVKGRKWIIDQNEIKYGIKDTLGVYSIVDESAHFKLGDSILNQILYKFKIDTTLVQVSSKHSFITLSFIVDENGSIDPGNINFEGLNHKETISNIHFLKDLWTNWEPAKYNGEKVKSKVHLPIKIQK